MRNLRLVFTVQGEVRSSSPAKGSGVGEWLAQLAGVTREQVGFIRGAVAAVCLGLWGAPSPHHGGTHARTAGSPGWCEVGTAEALMAISLPRQFQECSGFLWVRQVPEAMLPQLRAWLKPIFCCAFCL